MNIFWNHFFRTLVKMMGRYDVKIDGSVFDFNNVSNYGDFSVGRIDFLGEDKVEEGKEAGKRVGVKGRVNVIWP